MNCSTPGLPVHHPQWSLPKLMSIESVMPSSHLILCRPLLLLPPIPPSIRVFSNESTLCVRWPKDWSFSLSISPSIEHPGLVSFRMDWLHLLAVQGTLQSVLQHHSSKASVLYKCKMIYCYYISFKMVIFWGNLPYCFELNYLQLSSELSIEHIYLELWIIYNTEGVVTTDSI